MPEPAAWEMLMNALLDSAKPGDVIGFSGHHWASAGINLCTFGLPFWGLSHVGIVAKTNDERRGLFLFDSNHGDGVRCQPLEASVDVYHGKAWIYRLARPLYLHECARLSSHADSCLGLPYDSPGALRSGGLIWAAIQGACRGECLASFFCSEFVAEQLSYVGIFNTTNASRWSPNHLIRTLRRLGIVQKPERLK